MPELFMLPPVPATTDAESMVLKSLTISKRTLPHIPRTTPSACPPARLRSHVLGQSSTDRWGDNFVLLRLRCWLASPRARPPLSTDNPGPACMVRHFIPSIPLS